MLRKIASLSVALVVAGGVMIAVPAEAAVKISNGVACTKAGTTSKTTLGTYKCGTNPLSTSKKLVWLSTDCITAANGAVKAAETAKLTLAKFQEQIPVIEAGIANEAANKIEIQAKLDDAIKRLEAAKVLAAAATDANKRTYNSAIGSWNAAIRAYTSKIKSIETDIKRLEAAKLAAKNKPAELALNVADSRETAKLICTSGL
jgi:acyl-CoA synthetase (AMP-forming)/AMP-acid ligase II